MELGVDTVEGTAAVVVGGSMDLDLGLCLDDWLEVLLGSRGWLHSSAVAEVVAVGADGIGKECRNFLWEQAKNKSE